jgi:hypothetical protein
MPLAGAVLGGLMFGFGMALVGTCGFGALVRLGGGNLRALVVLTGLGLAALAAQRGLTAYFRVNLLEPMSVDLDAHGGQSLAALVSGSARRRCGSAAGAADWRRWIVVGVQIIGFQGGSHPGVRRNHIGLCIAAGWVITSSYADRALQPVQIEAGSFVMPVGDTILQIIAFTGELPDYGVGLVVGVFLGAAASAFRSDDMRWEACDDARELGRHLLGAFLMGTGGVFALGCTIGQGVSAFSLMAVSAPVVMISIAMGARMGLGMLVEGTPFGFIADWRAPDTKA